MSDKPQAEQERDKVELVATCSKCSKPIAKKQKRRITGWFLKPDADSCSCQSPSPVDPASPATAGPEELPSVGDDYEVISFLGAGAMGKVYKARHRKTGNLLAIKILNADLVADKQSVKWFQQEIKTLSKLTHPNLVNICGQGLTPEGRPYLAMDFVDGETLSDKLKRHGQMDRQAALDIFAQVAEALEHIHKAGVVHRDIKPSNIMISRTESGANMVRLVDFGIAKLQSDTRSTRSLTETSDAIGSPPYMSPEQCLGTLVTPKSDIYSTGCVLYEALTGEALFQGANAAQIISQHLSSKPTVVTRQKVKDGGLRQVIECCIKDDSTKRLSSEELLKDLTLLKDGQKPSYSQLSKSSEYSFSFSQLPAVVSVMAVLVVITNLLFLAFPIIPTASYMSVSLLTASLGVIVIVGFSLIGIFSKIRMLGFRADLAFDISALSALLIPVANFALMFAINFSSGVASASNLLVTLTPVAVIAAILIIINLFCGTLARKMSKTRKLLEKPMSKLKASFLVLSLLFLCGIANTAITVGVSIAAEGVTEPLSKWHTELSHKHTLHALDRTNFDAAKYYFSSGELTKAEEYFTRLIQSDVTEPKDKMFIYGSRAMARCALGKTSLAREDCRSFTKLFNAPDASLITNILSMSSSGPVFLYMIPGELALAEHDADEAISLLSQCEEGGVVRKAMLVSAYRLKGDDRTANQIIRAELDATPKAPVPQMLAGKMDIDEYLRTFESSDQKMPLFTLAGWKVMLDGDHRKALEVFKRAVEGYRPNGEEAVGMGQFYMLAKSQIDYLEKRESGEVGNQESTTGK